MEKERSVFVPRKTMQCHGKLLTLDRPLIMGIINVTPDSFFSGSRYRFSYSIGRKAYQMIEDGADIIDIGACSTRPGSKPVNENDELRRLTKALNIIRKKFPDAVISVDTFRASVAQRVVQDYSVDIINDISAGELDPAMFETVGKLGIPYVLMHMKGTPENMQQNPTYENVIRELIVFFNEKIDRLRQCNVKDIIIDPGFGFGKTLEHNYTILRNLEAFRLLEMPILVGLSRKSMIYKPLKISPDKALNGTTILNSIALQKGANILRVHDVKEAVEAVKLFEFYSAQPEYQHL